MQSSYKIKTAAFNRRMVNSQPQKIVIYIRVSTDMQEDSGLGLDAQLRLCYDVCQQRNLEVVGEFRETVSGKINFCDRQEFIRAVEQAQTTGARLMVAKLDRLSRRIHLVSGYVDGEYFEIGTPDLIIAESPDMSQLEMSIRAAIAQEERKMISDRTKAALAELKKKGVKLGQTGRTEWVKRARDATSEAIKVALEMRSRGVSYRKIAQTLNQHGYTTSKGGCWHQSGIYQRLKSLENESNQIL